MNCGISLSRRRTQGGNNSVELALVLLPFMALTLGIIDFSMPIFLTGTFTHAVREGCRYGITYNMTYNGTTYPSQTALIQAVVEKNSMGFLNNVNGPTYINVAYYSPVSPFGVLTGPGANAGGNILVVKIQGYSWNWIAPLWRTATALPLKAISADRLESMPAGSSLPTP